MAINYASRHARQIDERFSAGSVTEALVNKDYDFTGVKTVVVHSVPTVGMNDYVREGADRYGTPVELQDSEQELTMTQNLLVLSPDERVMSYLSVHPTGNQD